MISPSAARSVPAGTYALYTDPHQNDVDVVPQQNPNAGGTRGYDQKNDVARIT